MNKFYRTIFMFIILSIFLMGCTKINNDDKNPNGTKKVEEENINLPLLLKNKGFRKVEMYCPDVMDEIKYIGYFNIYGGQTFLVTENDIFYEVSINKLYQNQTNCKKVEENEWESTRESNFQLYHYKYVSNNLMKKLGSLSYVGIGRDQFVVIDNIPYVIKGSQNNDILNQISIPNNELIKGISDKGYLTTDKAFYS